MSASDPTLATPRNMREFEAQNPRREFSDGTSIEGRRCFAWSPSTDEQYSASPGDYFQLGDDEPLRDSEGEPMVLVVQVCRFVDALGTGTTQDKRARVR